jgi:hypothetical protein
MASSVGAQGAMKGLLCVVGLAIALEIPAASQSAGRFGEDANLTFNRGQSVEPVFHGWMLNPDGSFELYFSYINRNWQEELDIPIGPNNNIQPASFGPDGGQPTHFYPRVNRWVFTVHVPKDFGKNEVVWTLTAHGESHRAFGSLSPGYAVDEFMIMHEFGRSIRGRKQPTLHVEGEKQRAAKVGQPVELVAVATDPNPPGSKGGCGAGFGPGSTGGDLVRCTATGLRLAWLTYRGPAAKVTFDPPIPFKVWEDQRGGSPWAPDWLPPPIPPGNKWIHRVTFKEPGTYVLRAQAHDGYLFKNEDITFTVTP